MGENSQAYSNHGRSRNNHTSREPFYKLSLVPCASGSTLLNRATYPIIAPLVQFSKSSRTNERCSEENEGGGTKSVCRRRNAECVCDIFEGSISEHHHPSAKFVCRYGISTETRSSMRGGIWGNVWSQLGQPFNLILN